MCRCLKEGLVEGKNLAVDGTMIKADASQASRVPRAQLKAAAQVAKTAAEYLTELEQDNPVSGGEMVSTTDPDAILATKGGRTAAMAYYDNYLIDTASRVILGVEATPARFSQETIAARRMVERVEKLGIRAEELAADKAYGSGEFLAWLLARGVQPHIPVIDRRHQTDGHFTHDQFRYEPAENAYYCPEGKMLSFSRYVGARVTATSIVPRKRSARTARKRNGARPGLIADCLYTSKNPCGKPSAPCAERQPTSGHGGLATKSKLCLRNLSSAWG